MLQKLRDLITNGRFAPAKVESVHQLTPHMIRITLKSDLVKSFPETCPGGHLKLIVPAPAQSEESFFDFMAEGNFKSEMRTYTIRHAQTDAGLIDVDIVTHGDLGRVGPWAQRTQTGDTIFISKCGTPKLIAQGVKRIVAAADMTGFPALAAGLETLDHNVQVDAYVEILSADDQQPVRLAKEVNINWIIKPDPYTLGTDLIDSIRGLEPPDEQTSIFVAGEFSTVGSLRTYFQKDLKVDKSMRYISSYWKIGSDEPNHKIAKAAIS